MRWQWFLLLAVLLVACTPPHNDPTPAIIEITLLPTRIDEGMVVVLPPTATPSPLPTSIATRTPRPTQTTTPQPTGIPMREIAIAVQPVPPGAPIPPEAVRLVRWPIAALPVAYVGDVDAVAGEVAIAQIGCFEPFLTRTVAPREVGDWFEPLLDVCEPSDHAGLVEVVIATQDITPGAVIEPSMVTLRPWPRAYLPPGAVIEMIDVIGTTATTTIRQEQPLLTEKVSRR
jgi:Flp pilus assembly protein CpaB